MIQKHRELSCIYYPYADPKPSPSLLMAALLFDKMFFLEPNFFRRPSPWGDEEPTSYVESSLAEIGVFEEIGPSLMGFSPAFGPGKALQDESVTRELHASILADLTDTDLQKLTANHGNMFWSIPNGQYLFWNGLGLLLDTTKEAKELFFAEFFTSRTDYYEKYFAGLKYSTTVANFGEARVRDPKGELMVRLPFLPVQALMMAVTLHASREFGLIPFTDSLLHQRYLSTKLGASVRTLSADAELRETLFRGIDYTNLGVQSIEMSLPTIAGLTPEKVLKLRRKCEEELNAFRTELRRLVYEIDTRPWESDYGSTVTEIINTKVAPAVDGLKRSLRSLRSETGIALIESSIATAPLPLLLTISPGLPIEWTLPLSIGVVWFKELLKHFEKREKLKQNGLSFLLRLS
jgi:hypothetical protein